MKNGLLVDVQCEVLNILTEYGVKDATKMVKVNHDERILQIDCHWYNHEDQVMPSFDCRVWMFKPGSLGKGSPRRTFITFKGHISECSLKIVTRITEMMDDSWPRGTDSFTSEVIRTSEAMRV